MATSGDRTRFFHPRALEAVTLLLLFAGGLIPRLGLVGWLVGAVLLWLSTRWTVPEKLVATIIWPGGIGGLIWIAENQAAMGVETWAVPTHADAVWAWIGVLAAAVMQFVVLVALWQRSGRRAQHDVASY
jgi:hypothetical protein